MILKVRCELDNQSLLNNLSLQKILGSSLHSFEVVWCVVVSVLCDLENWALVGTFNCYVCVSSFGETSLYFPSILPFVFFCNSWCLVLDFWNWLSKFSLYFPSSITQFFFFFFWYVYFTLCRIFLTLIFYSFNWISNIFCIFNFQDHIHIFLFLPMKTIP